MTVVAGEFLTPFGTYNERLTPIWISNFESAPLIFPLGTMNTGSSVGGMVRGSAFPQRMSRSTTPATSQPQAQMSSSILSAQRGEERTLLSRGSPGSRRFIRSPITGSARELCRRPSLVGTGGRPSQVSFRVCPRSAFPGLLDGIGVSSDAGHECECIPARILSRSFAGSRRFAVVPTPATGCPPSDTNRADFGLNYLFPHEVRINTSYSRQFASTGNRNVWQTGIVYRFLFPTWRSK